ncbi:MAG: Cytochrome [Acidobacteria bacterium]|nr:Cytochrome [Acidobacteriota bacterium]
MLRDAPPIRSEDLDPPRYVIVSARVSPMVELARWLFERHRIPYEEEGHAPLLHVPFTLWRRGGVEVPVVVSAAQTWKGARETLHGLDSRLRAGERLFGEEPAERERNIAFVEQLLNRLLVQVRRFAYFHLLPLRRVVFPVVVDGIPDWERAAIAMAFPLWRRLMGRALDFSDGAIADARPKIEEAFTIVEAELAARGTPFLGGDTPNALDIIFSALVAPLTLPHGYGSKLPALDALPPELRQFVDSLRARRAGQLVFDTYAAARPLPQARLKRPRRGRSLAQRLFGPAAFRAAARAAVAWGAPIVVKRFALVSRWADVQQVLEHDLAYRIAPINGPNFHTISGAFVLGLDRGAQFARERRHMYDAVSRIDLEDLRAQIRGEADRIIADALGAGDRLDVAHGYAHPVAARTGASLFGIAGPTEADLMRVCRSLFHFSFLANPNETRVAARAGRAAEELRGWMVDEIGRRRCHGIRTDDVLGRLLDLQEESGAPLDADVARRILVGLLVGAIDTTAPTVPRIVCVLASDPALLARVRRDLDDPARMAGWCWEALRMWSPAPVLFRRTPAPVSLAGRTIPEGSKVAAFTQAAMFDRGAFPLPRQFDPARPLHHYMNFGGGLHPCGGRGVNGVQLPELVSRLLRHDIVAVGTPRFVGPFLDELVVTIRRAHQ